MSQATTKPIAASPETQELIDLCLQIKEGGMDAFPQMEALVSQRQSALTSASDQFFAGVEGQSPEFQEKYKQEIELISKLFEGYDSALEQILRYKAEPKPELLEESMHMLAFASNSLPSAMAAYEQRVLSEGEHEFAIINLFNNLGKAVRDGRAPAEGWAATCDQYLTFYSEAIREIDDSKHKDGPGVPERRKALEKIVSTLEDMKKLSKASSASQFSSLTDTLAEGHRELNDAVHQFNKAWTDTPTPSAAVNAILNTAKNVLDEKVQPRILRNLCTLQMEKVQKSISDLQMLARTPNESTVIQEETPKMLEAMEVMEEALTTLVSFCDGNASKEEATAALDELENSTMQIHGAQQTVETHNQNYGKVICPGCQTPNHPANKTCTNCSRVLPQMAGSEVYSSWGSQTSFQMLEGSEADSSRDTVMTDVMKDLFETCDKFQRGKLEAEELFAKLDATQANIDQAKRELSKLAPPPIPEEATEEERAKAQEFIDVCEESLELLSQGVEECEYGLQQIREGAQEDSSEKVSEGQRFYYQGCQKMWQVKRVDDAIQAYIHAPAEGEAVTQTTESVDLSSGSGA